MVEVHLVWLECATAVLAGPAPKIPQHLYGRVLANANAFDLLAPMSFVVGDIRWSLVPLGHAASIERLCSLSTQDPERHPGNRCAGMGTVCETRQAMTDPKHVVNNLLPIVRCGDSVLPGREDMLSFGRGLL